MEDLKESPSDVTGASMHPFVPQPLSIKPYYDDGKITLYHGDSSELLPMMPKVDLVITDPPYGMNYQSRQRAKKHKKIANDDQLPLDLIWLAIAKAKAAAYVFCRWNNLAAMPQPKSVVAWVKNHWSIGDLEHEHGRQWEACCFYAKASHEFVKRIGDVIYADKTGNALHPTEKPVSLIEQLIVANVGETILDPFAGSGTTLAAAKLCGKRAIGIELEEMYCETAAKRLSQGVLF